MDSLKRSQIKSIVGSENGGAQFVGQRVLVGGWVKSFHVKPKKEVAVDSGGTDVAPRDLKCAEALFLKIPLLRCIVKILNLGGNPVGEKLEAVMQKKMEGIAYLRINDGSCVNHLQIVLDSDLYPLEQVTAIGTSVLLEGVIEQAQTEGKYIIELKVDKVLHVGPVNPIKYPLSKSRLSLEAIRVHPHFRARTTTVASVMRIRSILTYAVHKFFQENDFHHVTMPVITTTRSQDHQTAFHITQLLSSSNHEKTQVDGVTLEGIQAAIKEKTKRIEELKRSDSNKEAVFTAEQDLKAANELAQKLENEEKKMKKVVEVDYSKDYFGCEAHLSVDPGLHLESYACALGAVYLLGPVFQPVEQQLSKNLAEMWVVNAEQVFAELECAMTCAEDCLKSLSNSIMTGCPDDIKFLSTRFDNKCMNRIHAVLSEGPLPRVSYTEAVEALQKVSDYPFATKVEWGITLSEEHRRYLADELHKRPIIVYNYPKEVKPFYSRLNDDNKTVSAFDIILPKVGTVVCGIQKEERNYMISSRIKEVGLKEEQFDWYLDLRRHGTVKHAGFQINFDQLVMFLTGFGDIRDVVPFPRTKNEAKC
ncbi:Asparagine--tRNA ligase [Rhynchospora pubera]|uniref:asparagine--tRNA ligase n=1 Tax=Rhynchospora pubera TaxID=906938 RepID=A0AAV8AMN2_9POAL|nr:Asparagine--tRNA ligase [Rhynchospora pubera]KAJ4795059.1 Asparagine--tRNA ligase [Rhynchospora pubera]